MPERKDPSALERTVNQAGFCELVYITIRQRLNLLAR